MTRGSRTGVSLLFRFPVNAWTLTSVLSTDSDPLGSSKDLRRNTNPELTRPYPMVIPLDL